MRVRGVIRDVATMRNQHIITDRNFLGTTQSAAKITPATDSDLRAVTLKRAAAGKHSVVSQSQPRALAKSDTGQINFATCPLFQMAACASLNAAPLLRPTQFE